MKAGRSLRALAQELERQREQRKDFITPAPALSVTLNESESDEKPSGVSLALNPEMFGKEGTPPEPFNINRICHNQIAKKTKIPRKYADLMYAEAPELYAHNVNHWFNTMTDKKFMVRTLDTTARALVSDRYRPLDNCELAEAVLPVLHDDGVEVVSCEVTEKRLYIKAVSPRTEREVKVGDPVQAGVVVSNSEVGCGSLKVEPLIYRLVCLNGMVCADAASRKYHTGKRAKNIDDEEGEESVYMYLRDKTRESMDTAVFMETQDLVRLALSDKGFQKILKRLEQATEVKITAPPDRVVEVTAKNFGLTDKERGSVLEHLIREGDLSKYGLCQAVTRASQDIDDYDRATEFERIGNSVIELSPKMWQSIETKAEQLAA